MKKKVFAMTAAMVVTTVTLAGCAGSSGAVNSTNEGSNVSVADSSTSEKYKLEDLVSHRNEISLDYFDKDNNIISAGGFIFDVDGNVLNNDSQINNNYFVRGYDMVTGEWLEFPPDNIKDEKATSTYYNGDAHYVVDGKSYIYVKETFVSTEGTKEVGRIYTTDGQVIFETDVSNSKDYPSTFSNKRNNKYFRLNRDVYKIEDGSVKKIETIPKESEHYFSSVTNSEFYIISSDNDGKVLKKDGNVICNASSRGNIDVNGSYVLASDSKTKRYELFDDNGSILYEFKDAKIDGLDVSDVKLLKGSNTDGYMQVTVVNKDGSQLVGILDKNGEWVIEPAAEDWKLSNGDTVNQYTYDSVMYVFNDLFIAKDAVKEYYIVFDKDKNFVVNFEAMEGRNFITCGDKLLYITDGVRVFDSNTREVTALYERQYR